MKVVPLIVDNRRVRELFALNNTLYYENKLRYNENAPVHSENRITHALVSAMQLGKFLNGIFRDFSGRRIFKITHNCPETFDKRTTSYQNIGGVKTVMAILRGLLSVNGIQNRIFWSSRSIPQTWP